VSLVNIVRETPIERTPRVQQIEGIFELTSSTVSREEWTVDLPLEEKDWNVGLIVGPSGSGKSTIAREIFGNTLMESFSWEKGKALVDSFPEHQSIKDISFALSSVGFGSPPNWLRPYDVLSTGEKFRADLARCLSSDELVVMDEFTSVVDRVVAQIGSNAMAKAVRRKGGRFVGVSCHYDIIEWLQPDWTYEPSDNKFTWRSVRRRPEFNVTIKRVNRSLWNKFSKYHYLNHDINKTAKCFAAFVDDIPVAFEAVLSFPHPVSSGWRLHRTVCLPDYQGLGIGTMLEDKVASVMRATGKPVYNRMSHPAIIRAKAKSPSWKMTSKPKRQIPLGRTSSIKGLSSTLARNRMTAAFKYVGKIDYESAKTLGVI
jgi:ABC-type lipoprotein export system ATPase subunit/GNAT superfamily N-acetyltransferase